MKKKNDNKLKEKKFLRIKDLMDRYGYSRGHIGNLITAGQIPPPMIVGNVKSWPIEVIDILDEERKNEYFEVLKKQGFTVPDNV